MAFEEFWEDFGIRIGPWGIGFGTMGRYVKYSRTENSHILTVRIDPDVKKEEVKVRYVKPGQLEIEWPRRSRGEEIKIE